MSDAPNSLTRPSRVTLPNRLTRRGFLARSARCASAGAAARCSAYLAGAAPLLTPDAWRRWMRAGRVRRVVAQTPFARIEEVGEGMFAVVSTPLDGDFTTVCNGGIVAGSSGTLAFEAFATPEGARWVAEQARALTGRGPDVAVVSHYHGDHSMGVVGLADAEAAGGGRGARLRATAATRDLMLESPRADEAVKGLWADAVVVPENEPVQIDLGDRQVTATPRRGHTASDVTVEVDGGEGPVWCGDLVWNDMFPNYMDAVPSRLSRTVRALGALPASTWVPGHGPLADSGAMARYLVLIDSVEEAAREAWRQGISADDAAAEYRVPEEIGDWVSFNPSYHQRAIQAWMDELAG